MSWKALRIDPFEAGIALHALHRTAAMRSLCDISFVDCSIALLPDPQRAKTAALCRSVAECEPPVTHEETES